MQSGCLSTLKSNILLCIGAAVGVGVGCIVGCIKFLQPTIASMNTCAVICAIAFVGTLIGCIWAKYLDYNACLANALATYRQNLTDNGCWPPPAGYDE